MLEGIAVDPGTKLTPDATIIGNHVGGAAGTSLNGRIAEVLVYNDSISATDLASVHSYLNSKHFGLAYKPIPGLFNTGVNNAGTPLADGTGDSHYVLNVNPDGTGPTPLVEDSTAFPIVGGPWVANSATSKWIGPRLNTGASAGGDYEYTISFDLSGFDPSTAYVSGLWATDNGGLDILINGVSTGLVNTAQFASFTPFLITSGFVSGGNTLTFRVNNASAGFTGLRIENLQGFAQVTVPEPATATFGLLALAATGFRRRRAAA